MRRLLVLAMFCLVACGGAGGDTEGPAKDEGFDPPEAAPGYTRFSPSPIELEPGEEGIWCQWVAGPSEVDQDVVDIMGQQSEIGHHAVLYATTVNEPVGTTRPCSDGDQLQIRFLGGIGGEGSTAIDLPPGTVFRLEKGRSLLVNTHYLNATGEVAMGESVVDVKLAEADPNSQVAAFFANVDTGIDLPPHEESSLQVSCTLAHDLRLLAWSNHMHAFGAKALTERVLLDGSVQELRREDHWEYEWAFNPQWATWPAEAPLEMKAGETLVTTCTWQNTSAETVGFPTEMCVGAAFFLGAADVTCHAGAWIE
jgi:hypothetical protein